MNNTKEYIKSNWAECIKTNMNDDGTLIGLPYPYTVPAVGHFDEIYYWDTYFTNLGLDICDMQYQSKFNVDNMLYLIEKYGYMPNGNRIFYIGRSQPPFLSEMVRNVYDYYKDKVWLSAAYTMLEKEYKFWSDERNSKIGLNTYGGYYGKTKDEMNNVIDEFKSRVGYIHKENTDEQMAKHTVYSCESGWDCNPRWEFDAYNYAPVDLNSLMYMFEKNMSYFSSELEEDGKEKWEQLADKRKERMQTYMISKDGFLLDYNFEKEKLSKVFSAASFYPMYTKLVSKDTAKKTAESLYRIEGDYGIYCCEKNDTVGEYQWDYPNGWACLQYIVVKGLYNYGYTEDAKRIAKKYISLVDKNFEKTGGIWEKYNVKDGNIEVKNEYTMPQMMGWSAGVYLVLDKYLNTGILK